MRNRQVGAGALSGIRRNIVDVEELSLIRKLRKLTEEEMYVLESAADDYLGRFDGSPTNGNDFLNGCQSHPGADGEKNPPLTRRQLLFGKHLVRKIHQP